MRLLIVKTSSLGDVIHTLPALTDAKKHLPELTVDWVVEEAYAEIPAWHPGVNEVIPVALRKWRKHPWRTWRDGTWGNFREELRRHYYDWVIDAQGLIKSAFLAWHAHGETHGLDRNSAREPWAAWAYRHSYFVPGKQHAIDRNRALFAQILGYPVPSEELDYGLNRYDMTTLMPSRPTLVFLHGTAWPTKEWPEAYWRRLTELACQQGFRVRLPWGNEAEKQRAQRIAEVHRQASLMPSTNLQGIAAELSIAAAVVGVDTGLAHLAAALQVPGITLYGATQPGLTGARGRDQVHLQANRICAPCLRRTCAEQGDAPHPPCYNTVPPERAWEETLNLLGSLRTAPDNE